MLVIRQDVDLFTEATFGSTAKEVAEALERTAATQTLGPVDARFALARLQSLWDRAREMPDPCRTFVISAKGEIGLQTARLERAAAKTLENLRRTAALLAGLPGPKTLLFVSDSLETRPGAELVRFAQNACPGEPELSAFAQQGDATHLQQQQLSFAEEANRNRITVYPFQASGLAPSSMFGADQGSFDTVLNSGVDSLLRNVRRDGLLELARQTGGWAVVDRNSFGDELGRLADDMSTYYSLAYSPQRGSGTGTHAIDVRAKGELAKISRVRHRLSYRDRGADDPLPEWLDGAIAFGAMRNPLGVRVGAGVLGAADPRGYAMPLHVLVPAARIAFLPQASGELAGIRVVAQARNARSKAVVRLEKRFRVARPPAGSELLDLRLVLQLPQGVHVVAVAVSDETTGESSVVATTVAIQDPAAKAAPSGSGS